MLIDIKTRRKELGLTLEEIGNRVGVSKSTVKKWESGYIKNMRRDKILLLAETLQVSPLDILALADTPSLASSKKVTLSEHSQAYLTKTFQYIDTDNMIICCSENTFTCFRLSKKDYETFSSMLNRCCE